MRKNNSSVTIIKVVLIYLFLAVIALIFSFFDVIGMATLKATEFAVGLNFINSLLAVSFFLFTANKSNKIFIIFNLGGMVFRIFLMIFSIIVIIKFLKIDINEFILVFFVIYFVQLFLEIKFYNRFNNKE